MSILLIGKLYNGIFGLEGFDAADQLILFATANLSVSIGSLQ